MHLSSCLGRLWQPLVLRTNHMTTTLLDYMRRTMPVCISCCRCAGSSLTCIFVEAFIFATINLSPNPVPGVASASILDCFPRTSAVRSFLIRRDVNLSPLTSPFHVFYCSDSYAGRRNPNAALVLLMSTIKLPSRHPWYGTVLVFKFATDACQDYVDMKVDDVVKVRNFFAFYA